MSGPRFLSPQEQSQLLDRTLVSMTSQNGRVETRSDNSAVVIFGKPVNHVLHLIVSIFCCGWWVPVWLLLVGLGGEKRATVSVDAYGNVEQHKAPMETHRIVILVIAAIIGVIMVLFWGSFVTGFVSN